MFHSKHPAALLHATARAVSGGAVYVSDKPGHQDHALLRRLVLPGGSVLRAKLPARPTKDILFKDVLKDNNTLLKVCGWGRIAWYHAELLRIPGIAFRHAARMVCQRSL